MNYLVTGAAGFIGYHVAERLLARGDRVLGLDNLNPYYDPALKRARLGRLQVNPHFEFAELDLSDRPAMERLFEVQRFQRVIHLAAQAGVRYSVTDPHAFADSNLTGFLHILEGCRDQGVEHLVLASTSSVYGLNARMPCAVQHGTHHPVSLYAATKQANELMAHSYAHLYRLPCTVLRYFTVYGPWGRPDMALFKWTRAILEGRPIEVYNYGQMRRDFTYIEDVVAATVAVADRPATPDASWEAAAPNPATSTAPFRIYNVGRGAPVALEDYLGALERSLDRQAERHLLPLQPGDVVETSADISDLTADFDFRPTTSVDEGVGRFVEWYRDYYGL